MNDGEFAALVVDDEMEIRDILVEFLDSTEKFKSIVQAEDGSDAFRKVQNQNFDIIVVDLAMPKTSGHEFIKTLRAWEIDRAGGKKVVHTPVMVFSGHITEPELKKLLRYKVKSFMAKPVKAADFITKVQELLPN